MATTKSKALDYHEFPKPVKLSVEPSKQCDRKGIVNKSKTLLKSLMVLLQSLD